MSREALVLLVCCCDFRDGAERLISSKSLRNAVIRAFPGLFRILRMCAPRRAAAVVRPRGREKSADRRRRILISRLLIIRAPVPRWKSPFPAYFKGFPAVSPLIPPYPAFLKYPVSPHQRQRISIARSLAMNPSFIICDEIVSALDVSIQAQIVGLMMKIQEELGLTYIFIGHDLSVVRHISNNVAVMYLGKIMELTGSDELYEHPLHPYTQALISAAPIPNPTVDRARERILLEGDLPSPIHPPRGCNFCTRCKYADERCRTEEPAFVDVGNQHFVACHKVAAKGGGR